ncbi:hemojuvelin [Takifugu rubripes]|uniref:Hemojuvelin BMP co-receptor n=1 Tax=Takifugu rubripes TaxID=31033 RepID=H2T9J7_TAKRU|nr:hemojuvelin [Takifugu rubripes]|eukprot:XP_011603502.1 PREDICTED: hemojuvelin [Takifugu rubripes]
MALPWKRLPLVLLWVQLSLPEVGASCRILRCNSDFVAATLDLGSSAGAGGGAPLSREAANAEYCRALHSYSTCTKRMARPCRGDLAYHSAVQGIEDLLIQYRCPLAGPTAQPRPLPPLLSGDVCLYDRRLAAAEAPQPDYLHCGVFGDPHIRTFNNDFHTCAVQGAWPLIDNDFLYVQATSSPTRRGTQATMLTKITVIVKSWRHCVDQQLYQAELDDVPMAFADGSVVSGERRGQHTLAIWTQSPGRHAEIRAAHIATVLVVRQSGRSLSLSVYSPRSVVEAFGPEQDLQLCMWGCPASQKLSTPPPTSSTFSAAVLAHCDALLPVRDVYHQACIFDLITSGDLNSSGAAISALQDAQKLISDPKRVHLLSPTSAAQREDHLCLLLLLLSLLLNF